MPMAGNSAATAPAAIPQPNPSPAERRVGSSCRRTMSTLPVSSFATTVASKSCDDAK
jgi:hypothetical protein